MKRRAPAITIIAGTGGDDVLEGNGHPNWLISNGGNDELFGRPGDDVFTVGRGDDVQAPDHVRVHGGSGNDLVDFDDFGRATGGVVVRFGPYPTGPYRIDHVENASGTEFNDTAIGDHRTNSLYGSGGADTLLGGGHADLLYGDARMAGTTDGSTFSAPVFSQSANGGDDLLRGQHGEDRLFGGAGDDRLYGGHEADQLTGGPGADRFVFNSFRSSFADDPDTILDFQHGDDRIEIAHLASGAHFHFGNTGGPGGYVDAHYDAARDVTVVAIYSHDGEAGYWAINLTGNIALTANDFVF